MKKRICLIYNYAQHYRTNIFMLMDRELPIDFVFGDKYLDVKKMDYSLLENFKEEVKNRKFLCDPFTYQSNVLSLLQSKYTTFLMLGDLHCVSTWLMLILGRVFRKKVFLWSHGWYGKENKLKVVLKKIFFGLAKGTFLYGDYAKGLMIKAGLKEEKLFTIYNSLMYSEHIILRKMLLENQIYNRHFNNSRKNLIFIGRLTKQKRIDLLIESLVELKKKKQSCNLIIVGSGEKEEDLKNLTKALGLEKEVWFYGACYDEKALSNLIFNADLCVSPGNVGLTAIHSLTFGTPVVTHNNFPLQMPEFEVIEEGVTGSFFEYGNVPSLAEAISSWFFAEKDRGDIRKNCYKTIDAKWNPYYQIEVFKNILG